MDKRNATLVILAAGLGSRFGGLKQIAGVGPQGEKIIEYTIHDALASGFTQVVCVIRQSIEEDFRRSILQNLPAHVPVSLAFQEMEMLPEGITLDTQHRIKPWGTAHALWCARQVAPQGPFAVVNADDFYGRGAFRALARFLLEAPEAKGRLGMVGYPLAKTLSKGGPVSRGVCSVSERGELEAIVEHTKIERQGEAIISYGEPHAPGQSQRLPESTVVSMNCWGFSHDFWEQLTQWLNEFFHSEAALDPKKECYIPWAVWRSLEQGLARCSVLPGGQQWCGITNPEDADQLHRFLIQLTAEGEYRPQLFSDL